MGCLQSGKSLTAYFLEIELKESKKLSEGNRDPEQKPTEEKEKPSEEKDVATEASLPPGRPRF